MTIRSLLLMVVLAVPGSTRADSLSLDTARVFADVISAERRLPRELRFDAMITFEPGSARVYSASRERLMRLARSWQQRTRWGAITVEGYASSRSKELAQRRADKIRDYLIRYGLAPDQVIAVGRTTRVDRIDLSIQLCEAGGCR